MPSGQCKSTTVQKYTSDYTGVIRAPSTLEVRKKSDMSLVGFESFPGYRIWSYAFDDQGRYGAVLTTRVLDGKTMLIVFNELA